MGPNTMSLNEKNVFRQFLYRGKRLEQLLKLQEEKLINLFSCRVRRKLKRVKKRKTNKQIRFITKIVEAKNSVYGINEKPSGVKTHLRNIIIVPAMVGSIVGVHNGKTFNEVEIKSSMIGMYIGEFSATYKAVDLRR